jgi:N-acetyl-anhydromuramyl-L-alanine amidase AmpD
VNRSSFIARGESVSIAGVDVHTWIEHGMHFTSRMRALPTRAIVNHWTGGENGPSDLYRNLREHRGLAGIPEPLSVHFAVDAGGEVWQFADTEARCSHARGHGANSWAIGIEFICRGTAGSPRWTVERERRHDRIHGRMVSYDDLTGAQIETGIRLNAALCEVYKLPLVVPESRSDVISGELTAAQVVSFRGCLGHLHVEAQKNDPGLTLLRAIGAFGRLKPLPPRVG